MPTISAMFRLMDGYSSKLDKFIGKVDSAATKVLRAGKDTDTYNDSIAETGRAAGLASSGLSKLNTVTAVLNGIKKTMDLTDSYTNTEACLKRINDGTQTQAELQQKVLAAADRSRGSYTDMAGAVDKMNLLAGDSFGSNDEMIGFTELLQKSLKVSGAGTSQQQSAFLQLTQAMASGKLQGDDFSAVEKSAPMVTDAMAKYLGVTRGQLKELSSEGALTAGIVKNALFYAADDINAKFASMPMTFSDIWSEIKNAGMGAFGGVFKKISDVMNSPGVQGGLDDLIGAIYLAGDAMEKFIGFCVDAWPMVSPFIWAAAVALGAYAAVQLVSNGLKLIDSARTGVQVVSVGLLALAMWATTGATWATVTAELGLTEAQLGANAAIYACPLVWIIGLILFLAAAFYAVIAAINHFTGSTISATGIIGSAIGILVAGAFNKITLLWNCFANFANFIGNVFSNPGAAIKVLFYDMAITVLGYIQTIARGIEDVINKIPSVNVDLTSGVSKTLDKLEKDAAAIKDESGWKEYVKKNKYIDYSDAAAKGYEMGKGAEDWLSNLFAGFKPEGLLGDNQPGSQRNPTTIQGTGNGGTVKVENEEDVEWMRKLAERDFVARIAANTLAPNIKVEFTGPITKETDVDHVMGHVAEQLRDAIATAPEGVPA